MTEGAWACDNFDRPITCRWAYIYSPEKWCPACKTNPHSRGETMELKEYRKAPEPVQAVMLTKDNVEEVAVWCGGQPVTEMDALDSDVIFVGINVPTRDGPVRASETDFISKNSRGEISVERYGKFLNEYEES